MKITERHREDFWAYVRWQRRTDKKFMGDVGPWPRGRGDALFCFAELESTGRVVPSRHPRLMRAYLIGKRKLNWQIGEWAAGVAEGTFFAFEFMVDYPWLPRWVWVSLKNKVYQLVMAGVVKI